ncbi:MAG: MFS transporter [Gemmatimonadota bacterium]|nr:MAG: MFS transporter [Gemmatimonadota bacterium]
MSHSAELAHRASWAQRLGLGSRELRAWAMYDWANSAFATTIMAAFLPLYFSQVAASQLPGAVATAYWGYTTAIALAIIAVLSPVLGAVADYRGAKKPFLAVFMSFGVTFTALLYFVGEGDWRLASAIFILANIGFSGANVFYESLLPSVAHEDEVDRVSTAGYAMGYVGGGVLLALNAAWFVSPGSFGFADPGQAVRASFVSAAVWWALFSLPLFRSVREPVRQLRTGEVVGLNPATVGFSRVAATLRDIRGHPDLFLFLLAFLIYNDGVGTIIKMAAIYGAEVGIGAGHLIGALLLVQFVGVPFTFGFGHFAHRVSAKSGIFICLAAYSVISVFGFFMEEAWQFWALAVGVAMVQGGVQGLSRSLYASMIPTGRSSEFFGFYSVSSKFAGIAGPLVFATVGLSMGSSTWGVLSLLVFFGVGAALLTQVDVTAGQRLAREEDSAMRRRDAATDSARQV